MYSAKIDISPYLETKVAAFIADPVMKKHTMLTLKHMGFTNLNIPDVPSNYYEALNRVVPIIAGDTELILMNLPARPYPAASKKDLITVYDMVNDNYQDLKVQLAKRKVDPLTVLSKTVPMIEVGDYLREKLIEVLVKYRVPSAFFLTAPMAVKKSETPARKEWKAKKNIELFYTELSTYLNYYFRDRDELVALVDDKLNEKELTERKKQYDELTRQAEEAKNKGDVDTAINLLRQAIDIFPQDIEAFLESGRLYVRKREYGRALIRYGQAEDLFEEAPEPNKEIGNLRLTQVREKVKSGSAPDSPEIMEMLQEAVENYRTALGKAADLESKQNSEKNVVQHESVTSIASGILKWNLGALLGPKHPMVGELLGVVQESTEKLDSVPLDQLTGSQCLAMALNSWQKNEIASAEMYFFQALKDVSVFSEACTEINKLGMRLRKRGQVEDAIEVYEKLLKYEPPNKASVYMNMAIACASKNQTLEAAGYATMCMYTDPDIAREDAFYTSITPAMSPILIQLIKKINTIADNSKNIKPSPPLVKLTEARGRLIDLIKQEKRLEALRLFINLYKKAAKYTLNMEFFGDGIIPQFIKEIRPSLAKNPKQKPSFDLLTGWLKKVSQAKTPGKMVQFFKLLNEMAEAVSDHDSPDFPLASFIMGKALVLPPESYFKSQYFYCRKTQVALVRELVFKFRYLNPDYFPKHRVDEESGQTIAVMPKKKKKAEAKPKPEPEK